MGLLKQGHCGICCKVSRFPTSEAEHQKLGGLLQEIVPTWKWEDVNINY